MRASVLAAIRDATELLEGRSGSRPGVLVEGDPALDPLIRELGVACDHALTRALLALHARAVDLPADPALARWLAALHPSLRVLVSLAMRYLDVSPSVMAEIARLQALVGGVLDKEQPLIPPPTRFPLAALHGAFAPCASPTDASQAAYRRYALLVHLLVRQFQAKLRASPLQFRPRLYDYMLSVQRVIPHLPL